VYAVIEDSGQQFRVSEGDVLNVDLRDIAEGAKNLEFGRVLMLSHEGNIKVGTPVVDGAKVVAEILDEEAQGPKLYHYHWRRRKHSRRKTGHRQQYIQVRVTKIVG
jgi:large subunit ribosomal protein L21